MTNKTKFNGGVEALALAMQHVFKEILEVNNQPVMESMDGLRTDMSSLKSDVSDFRSEMNKRIDTTDKNIKTTNENMSAQFTQQEKKIGKLFKESRTTP